MYNRYIPNGGAYTRVSLEDGAEMKKPGPDHRPKDSSFSRSGSQGRSTSQRMRSGRGTAESRIPFPNFPQKGMEGIGGLDSLLKGLKLEHLDSGDVLLLLIILLLLVEGDHIELVIALGLVLIMGLGDEEEDE